MVPGELVIGPSPNPTEVESLLTDDIRLPFSLGEKRYIARLCLAPCRAPGNGPGMSRARQWAATPGKRYKLRAARGSSITATRSLSVEVSPNWLFLFFRFSLEADGRL